MSAGQLLREARARHGLTQKQLAIRARTSQAAISRIERGLVSPTVETLEKLLAMVNEELVLEAREFDWGHDRTLNQSSLRRDVGQRLATVEGYADLCETYAAVIRFARARCWACSSSTTSTSSLSAGWPGRTRVGLYDRRPRHGLRAPANLERLSSVGTALDAKPRATRQGRHSSFETRLGQLDILDRPDGSPAYDELKRRAGDPLDVEGLPVFRRVVGRRDRGEGSDRAGRAAGSSRASCATSRTRSGGWTASSAKRRAAARTAGHSRADTAS